MTPGLIWERSQAISLCLVVFPAGTAGTRGQGQGRVWAQSPRRRVQLVSMKSLRAGGSSGGTGLLSGPHKA